MTRGEGRVGSIFVQKVGETNPNVSLRIYMPHGRIESSDLGFLMSKLERRYDQKCLFEHLLMKSFTMTIQRIVTKRTAFTVRQLRSGH